MPQNFNYLIDGSSLFMPTLGDVSTTGEGNLYKDSSNVFPLSEDFMSKVTNALIIYNEDHAAE